MQIGAIGTQISTGYVYNTNTLSHTSMNPVAEIPEDVLERKVDQSGMSEMQDEAFNTLKPGETRNFMDILTAQMEIGKNRASQILQTGTDSNTPNENGSGAQNSGQQNFSAYAMNHAAQAYMSNMGIV